MRLRPNGTLDYRPMPEPSKPWDNMTYEEQRQHFIDWILYYHPMADPEEAAEVVDAFFQATSGFPPPPGGRQEMWRPPA
jgi:hypothetical protein